MRLKDLFRKKVNKNQDNTQQETLLSFKNGEKDLIERVDGIIPGLEIGKQVTYLPPNIQDRDMQGVYQVVEKGNFDRMCPGQQILGITGTYIRQVCLEKIK